ncbi:MAG: carbamoyl phosphate synthase small subunit [Oscillospiraceae bacterium]|nr:carbamoyl phosphate synthase small subunit [Oscillospiraceae bacterium]
MAGAAEINNQAYLVLENGRVFPGRKIGDWHESVGELVFTTGMTGYLETLTDPSYAGQIILQTFPLIGNYGVIPEDFEGDCFARGYVVRELCDSPSNFRSEGTLNEWLKARKIPGLCGVDTRAITRILRNQGTMNALLCENVPEDLGALQSYRIRNAVAQVSCGVISAASGGDATGKDARVALIDYGAKRNIQRCLEKRGASVTVYPHFSTAEEILAGSPDGIMLSNGPGDPEENVFEIEQIRKLIGKLPVFGICLGHQLTALAMGGKTVKLKYGHHGANQPVSDGERTWITSQNHNYAVLAESLEGVARQSFFNANDGSCEGLSYPGLNCFTVQFHPEACGGPHDTEFLFDRFLQLCMQGRSEQDTETVKEKESSHAQG